jgi:peptidoglycan hydrolase-like protein with peptidoglycan-binding domain
MIKATLVIAAIISLSFTQLNPAQAETDERTHEAVIAMQSLHQFGENLDRQVVIAQAGLRALRAGHNKDSAVQDALRVYFLQEELNNIGLSTGEPDGVSGSKTRAAVNMYASNNNVSNNFEAVFLSLYSQHITDQVPVAEADLPEVVKEAISSMFNDPYSTRFSNVTVRELSSGLKIYCGSVNAKNAFGAYVGAMPFYAPEYDYYEGKIDTGLASDQADLLCHFRR